MRLFAPSQLAIAVAWVIAGTLPAVAQTAGPSGAAFHFTVDPPRSLAWYQVNPHTAMLWATTCPEDPDWRPGDSRNANWNTNNLPLPKKGAAHVWDSTIPLYRRRASRPVCKEGVRGEITAEDTVTWQGLKGWIEINPNQLESGLPLRDRAAQRDVFASNRYHTIRFEIDSLGEHTTLPGDTLRGQVYGRFFFRDVQAPSTALFSAWHDAAGLRVVTRLDMIPTDLVVVYDVPIVNIRLGLMKGIWDMIHFGVDAVLTPK